MDELRKCRDCGEERPILEFHKHARSPGGRLTRCKWCENSKRQVEHVANPEIRNARQRKNRERPEVKQARHDQWQRWYKAGGEALRQKRADYQREQYWSTPGAREKNIRRHLGMSPEKKREIGQRHKDRHPEKVRARAILGYHKRAGNIEVGPCTDCGCANDVQAHHHDYTKPLDVTWVCDPCHRARHRAAHRATP